MVDFHTSIDIDAPPEVVFAYLVDAQRMVTWMGEWAELDPVPGGVFGVDINGSRFRGTYVEVDPPRKVAVSWGLDGSDDLPAGSSRVEFTLTPTATGTLLDLLHTALPETRAQTHGAGWTHYLRRLQLSAIGNSPGIDSFRPARVNQ